MQLSFVLSAVISHHFLCEKFLTENCNQSTVSLNEDLATSELCQNPSDDLQELVLSYNSTLVAALDKHAPLMTRTIVQRPHVPWFTHKIWEAKRQRRKAEKRWRKSRL